MTLIIPTWALVTLIILFAMRFILKFIQLSRIIKQLLKASKYVKDLNKLNNLKISIED